MASQDDVLKMVASVIDDATGPLAKIRRAWRDTYSETQEGSRKTTKELREHAKAVRELHERLGKLRDTTINLVSPAFAAVGLSIAGTAEAIKSVVEATRSYGEAGERLKFLTRGADMSVAALRRFEEMGQRLGVSSEAMDAGMSRFNEFMEATARHAPAANDAWTNMGAAIESFRDTLTGLSREDQLKRVLEFGERIRDVGQRRNFFSVLGLPDDFATRTRAEIDEALRAADRWNRARLFNPDQAERTARAWSNAEAAFRGIKEDLGAAFSQEVADGLEKVQKFLESPGALQGFKSSIAFIHDQVHLTAVDFHNFLQDWERLRANTYGPIADKLSEKAVPLGDPNRSLSGPLDLYHYFGLQRLGGAGLTPQDRINGAFDAFNEKKTEETVAKGTTRGVLDAFREWMTSKDADQNAQRFAGGLQPMAYHPGAGGASYRFGSREYPLLNGGVVPKSVATVRDMINGSRVGGSFDRDRFAKELEEKPWLKEKIFQLAAGEDRPSKGESLLANQAVMETMMNRAIVRGTSLEEQAKWYGRERGGYYAGRPSRLTAQELRNSEENLRKVLQGSNITDYATDNSSGGLAARERATGKFRFHQAFNGESFFSPGWAEPAFKERYEALRQQIEMRAAAARAFQESHGAHLRDHIRHLHQHEVTGNAKVHVSFENMPRGTRTKASASGLFKEVTVNRGSVMRLASSRE